MGERDRATHVLGRVRKPGTGDRKMEKDAEGRGRSREGRIYGHRESGEARARAFPDRAAAKPGGADLRTEIIFM